jgi:hypothetical protein
LAVLPAGFYFSKTLSIAYAFMICTFTETSREGYPLPAQASAQAFFGGIT